MINKNRKMMILFVVYKKREEEKERTEEEEKWSFLLPTGWTFDSFDDNLHNPSFNPSFVTFSTPIDHRFEILYPSDTSYSFVDRFTVSLRS